MVKVMKPFQYAKQYQETLLTQVLPFWLKYSKDEEYGGYFTCLLQDGNVFDTDKFIWLQARQVWTFSMLYNKLEPKEEWLQMALHGADFLEKYGRDENGHWYFSLNQMGKPLVQAYNIFSDCFASMAFGQLYQATQIERYAHLSKTTFLNILKRQHKPKGIYDKQYPGTRSLKNFALPMILCNLCLEIEHLLDPEIVEDTIHSCISQIMEDFYNEGYDLILENINQDGTLSDTFDGRLLNPGHAIEAMWFLMDLGFRQKDQQLIVKAVRLTLRTLEYGWDRDYGGIFYFMDIKGYPPQQLEWDQKLWWVHLETLVALAKGYQLTGHPHCWEWFEKVHAYTWTHFSDTEYGEWFGYLNRRGEVLLPLKGGKWKGCFHVPRGLWQVWQALEKADMYPG